MTGLLDEKTSEATRRAANALLEALREWSDAHVAYVRAQAKLDVAQRAFLAAADADVREGAPCRAAAPNVTVHYGTNDVASRTPEEFRAAVHEWTSKIREARPGACVGPELAVKVSP